MGPTEFSTMVLDENLRKNFVKTSVEFLKKNQFDGLGMLSTSLLIYNVSFVKLCHYRDVYEFETQN